MRERSGIRRWQRWGGSLVALLMAAAPLAAGGPGPRAAAVADSVRTTMTLADPPDSSQLALPEDLARALDDSTALRPVLFQVGFKVLFRSGHIRGSRFVGPGSKPEGLAALRLALREIPRTRAIVLYCGCCPWADCPNVHPAFHAARKMGFRDVRVLFVAKSLQHDWIEKGLPTSDGDR